MRAALVLIRIAQAEVEARAAAVRDLQARREALDAEWAAFEQDFARQDAAAASILLVAAASSGFERRMTQERALFATRAEALDNEIADARAALQAAMVEQRRYERLAETAEAREREEERRREDVERDEATALRAGRRPK